MPKINLKVKIIQFGVVAFLFFSSAFSFAEIGRKEFESVERVSNYILSKYSNDQYIYVGIGRSPVPVMAYLQTERDTVVRNIPLTGFRYGSGGYAPLTPEEELRLYHHFDEFLPKDSELDGRKKLVIIDFAFGGGSIAATQTYFKKYIEHHRKSFEEAHAVAIAMETTVGGLKSMYPSLGVLPLTGSISAQTDSEKFDHFLMMMASKFYKDKAEYENFDIKNPKALKPRLAYQEYVNEMKLAKTNHKFGLLNDEWINTMFEIRQNPEKYASEIATLNSAVSKLSDTEWTEMAKELISKITTQKKLEAKKSLSNTPESKLENEDANKHS